MEQEADQQRVQEFAGKLLDHFTGGMLSFMVDIGYKTGLLEAATQGPATSQQLSERANLNERYVREWLGAMTTGRIFSYDPASRTYTLPPEHAMVLTGENDRSQNLRLEPIPGREQDGDDNGGPSDE